MNISLRSRILLERNGTGTGVGEQGSESKSHIVTLVTPRKWQLFSRKTLISKACGANRSPFRCSVAFFISILSENCRMRSLNTFEMADRQTGKAHISHMNMPRKPSKTSDVSFRKTCLRGHHLGASNSGPRIQDLAPYRVQLVQLTKFNLSILGRSMYRKVIFWGSKALC